MRRSRAAAAGLASLVVLGGGLGYVVGDAYDAVPGVLTVRPEPTPPAPHALPPGAEPRTSSPAPVLPPVGRSPAPPDPAALAATLDPLLSERSLGSSVGAVVADGLTGQVLLAVDASPPREPASVVKLLTAAAALSRLGGDATVPTRAVTGGAPDEVVLLAGGDVLLGAGQGDPNDPVGRAGLADLAAQTAASLRGEGVQSVAVRLDDTIFSGPRMGPGWTQADLDLGFVAPVSAVAVNAGRVRDERYAPRVRDPGLAAAATFAHLLAVEGIEVMGDVTRVAAPQEPHVLGEVRSAPLQDVVGYMLAASDNTVAEALARLVAVEMGRPTTFPDAARAVLDEVAVLGVDVSAATLSDGSGLSDGSALPARVLTDLLVVAASEKHPELRPLLTGLPVAGLEGTLGERFDEAAAAPAVGIVRAKTGSLTGVTSLAGTVTDVEGRLLVFAVLADAVPSTHGARDAVDAVAGALASCGCRS